MRVLVCGGRDFNDEELAFRTLDEIHAKTPITAIIEGCAKGADYLGASWAFYRGITQVHYKADWTLHGVMAGPIRNQRMLDEGRPNLVVAFPGGRGTYDMVKRAKKMKVRVIEVRYE